ncbi:MAG: protein kinase [Candidatus Solibacter usitatus]|nr:protein kinase [Candidatus Solibacter usitatus]
MVPPKIKGRYEIKAVLGQGGMGLVYRAFDAVIRRDVALKTLRDAPNRAALELFYKECDILASMSHPNIVEIFDLGEFEEDGANKPYFVMPLLPGMPLDKLIREGSHRLTIERSAEIITQACRGLQAAHERGLVHRDLKPSNIFVMDDDSVKIIDFGVAHMVDARSTVGHKGTLLYMAPEQVEMKPPSPLSDIFSLGVVCYETMTRRQPFERTSANEIALAVLNYIPPPVSDVTPAANQAVSRVVHKAMAKQPWHRFSTAREFSDSLQKALRNEPIEFFDAARLLPRVQRATKAFEQADYQFADEILSELEAEGHVDPAMSMLRRQIDQAKRQKTIAQLLDSARTRIEEEEFPLALQKIQEVLQLDADNSMALTLKSNIENKRSQNKIDDWFRLARQHLDQNAFSHARNALQNVLEIKPRDSRAMQLMSEVDRREQDYVKVRHEKEKLYENALEAWHDGEVSAALSKLEKLVDLDRRAPDTSTPERAVSFQNFYNQVRTEHDAIKNAYAEARKALVDGNFSAALAICNEYLIKHPGHALFQALKYDVEERQRQGVSARIAEVDRAVEAEPDVEKRVNILTEARDLHPDEPHFERSLRLMRDKRDLVNSIVAKARTHEERGQFNEALGQWEILKTIYMQYPGLIFEIERVVKRRDQQIRSEGRVRWVEQIDRQLELSDFARAKELAQNALAEFPADAELLELEKLAAQGTERGAEAKRLLAQGQELCGQDRFDEGIDTLRKAFNLDERNPIIRGALFDTLLQQARMVLETNAWESADPLIQQALELDAGNAQARSLRTLLLDRKREEYVNRVVSQARQLQTAGDLEAALKEITAALSEYPRESRLTQLHGTLSKAYGEVQRLSNTRDATSAMAHPPAPATDKTKEKRTERPAERASFAPDAETAVLGAQPPDSSATATVVMPLNLGTASPAAQPPAPEIAPPAPPEPPVAPPPPPPAPIAAPPEPPEPAPPVRPAAPPPPPPQPAPPVKPRTPWLAI